MRFNSASAIFRDICTRTRAIRSGTYKNEFARVMMKFGPPPALSILWREWHSNKFYRTKASPRLLILVKLSASIVKTRLFRLIAWNSRTAGRTVSALGYNKLLKFRTQGTYFIGNFFAAYYFPRSNTLDLSSLSTLELIK